MERTKQSTQVVIIGAGPYGLSLAAHLQAVGVPYRIFGKPMQTWQEQMPAGMHLKSDGFASNLSDAQKSFPLGSFCAEIKQPYHDTMIAVPLACFIAYGKEFQRRLVPNLDTQNVARLERTENGFTVTLEDGSTVTAAQVVAAVGISRFEYVPPVFDGLSRELVTHSAAHAEPAKLAGRDVTVIGGGASGLGLAALLHDSGAKVTCIVREKAVKFSSPPTETRSLWQRLRHPMSEMGPGLRSWMAQHFPHIFRLLPAKFRVLVVKRHLGPSGGYYSRDSFKGNVAELVGCSVKQAEAVDGKVKLTLDRNGTEHVHVTGHVICATGYRVNLDRLAFLPESIKSQIETVSGAPVLDRNFQSTVPGLFFVGPPAANSFGPLMRFACGARYTSTWLAKYLRRRMKQHSAAAESKLQLGDALL
ncbi:MAG TPA: NAD(P)-binding domain-containing protein [Acidobacteriaceae bacterium]|jgi:thioredoxin reductase|nr:NAD(P)-binding domain-containing protein [Acidobacteriaceae bacterium]